MKVEIEQSETIYKFPLEVTDIQTLTAAPGEILTVQVQRGVPCLWIKQAIDAEVTHRIIEIYGTGHDMRTVGPGLRRDYIGTFQMHDGDLVFHAFEIVVVRDEVPTG